MPATSVNLTTGHRTLPRHGAWSARMVKLRRMARLSCHAVDQLLVGSTQAELMPEVVGVESSTRASPAAASRVSPCAPPCHVSHYVVACCRAVP